METDVASVAVGDAAGAGDVRDAPTPFTDVVADAAHALRNHFHRLYYWLDVLGEQRLGESGRSALAGAAQALRSVEALTAGTVALSRDLELACISMTVAELTHGIRQSLERQGAEVRLLREPPENIRVSLDASQVSRTIEIVGARLGVSPDGVGVTLDVEVDDEGWVVVTLHARGATDATADDVERKLEWAQAERVVRAHGGRLLWEDAGVQEHRTVLVLAATK